MKLKIKEEVVLERDIDLEGLLHVLKEESKVETPGRGGATVRVDKNILKDAALVIEELLSQLKGKECCKTPEVKIKESEDAKEKAKTVAETFEEKVNDDLIIDLLLLGILDGLKL